MAKILSNLNRFTKCFNMYLHYLVICRQLLVFGINVSQRSVATYASSGGIVNNQFTANLPKNLPVKAFANR